MSERPRLVLPLRVGALLTVSPSIRVGVLAMKDALQIRAPFGDLTVPYGAMLGGLFRDVLSAGPPPPSTRCKPWTLSLPRGGPRGLLEEIPLGARVFAVADAYDVITSDRPHRRVGSHASAVREIKRSASAQFDPRVVEAFLAANRKGLIEDKAFCQEEDEEAAVVHVVGQGAQGAR